ncbi:AraC family transcriptional regulator [Brenneria populi subsp. brevivirga]|uniref:helix-turn-helix transcriptional regulator n=1 Tax=Brenneria populi TaxID=1505588 RepID=UPI002E187B9B|nr:AraC family transcriptional regulator [Brenneria populi subsp. brevivirga]
MMKSAEFFTDPGFPCPPGMSVKTLAIRPGMELSLAASCGAQTLSAATESAGDAARVHFNCQLSGQTRVACRERRLELARGRALTTFLPDERFQLRCSADWSNIELRVCPPLLRELAGDDYGAVCASHQREDGLLCHASGQRSIDAAERIGRLMTSDSPSALLVHAAALEFLAWNLMAVRAVSPRDETIGSREQKQLWQARELLLNDLSKPPTIERLARATGLNPLKIKRGFKQLFGVGAYALFQRKRMERARELLRRHSVTETAAMLGYSNPSHFSAAFRKQFGVLPKEARRLCL